MVKKNRSLLERASAIFKYLEAYSDISTDPISKSEFQIVGISPRDMDRWIELITFIQSMPKLFVKKKGTRTYLSSIENKFMLHMKKIYQNPEKLEQDRESAILLYFKTLLAMERLTGEQVDIESIVNESWKIDRPTIVRLAEEALSKLDLGSDQFN